MAFLHSVIGDNTPENREWLEKVGYKCKYSQVHADIICTGHNTGYYSAIMSYDANHSWFKDDIDMFVDCRNNPKLFRAVTAMRDDSDYMQWFVCDVDIFTRDYDDLILEKGSFDLSYEKDFIGIYDDYPKEVHKATLSELQAHFQRV